MKKIFLLMVVTILIFSATSLAAVINPINEIVVYRRVDLSYEKYLTLSADAKKVVANDPSVDSFSSGNTTLNVMLPASINMDNLQNLERTENAVSVDNFLSDVRLAEYLNSVNTTNLSANEANIKKNEITDIANQVRALYRRANYTYLYYDVDGSLTIDDGNDAIDGIVGPNIAGLSNVYMLDRAYQTEDGKIKGLTNGQGKLLFWENGSKQPRLVYNDNIWDSLLGNSGGGAGAVPETDKNLGYTSPGQNEEYFSSLQNPIDTIKALVYDEEAIQYLEWLSANGTPQQQAHAKMMLEEVAASRNWIESGDAEVVPEGVSDELKKADDFHKYAQGSLIERNLAVRSAEYNVIGQCWGDCGNEMNMTPQLAKDLTGNVDFNMNLVPKNEVEGPFEFKVIVGGHTFTHNFGVRYYYAQDKQISYYTDDPYREIICILTEKNYKNFERAKVMPKLEEWYPDYEDEDGNWIDQSHIRVAVAAQIKDQAREFVNGRNGDWSKPLPNGGYARIGVITEGYEEKDFFIFEPNTYDVGFTVFAQDPKGVLVGIKTGVYNDVFRQDIYEPEPEATDIEHANIHPEQENKKQYRLKDITYYLCEKCSTCDKPGCIELVASGEDINEIGQYFSHYCGDHACRFVWRRPVDTSNPAGSFYEELKCRDEGFKPSMLCAKHECKDSTCFAPIVGVSKWAEGLVEDDHRATGSTSESDYSECCADHKCRYVGCRDARTGGQKTAADKSDSSSVKSPKFCTAHDAGCVYCGKPVSVEAYGTSGELMICMECQNEVKEAADDVKQGTCKMCGTVQNLYNGNYVCNTCFMQKLWPLASLMELRLSMAIKTDMIEKGYDPEYRIGHADGLKGTVYGPDGEVLYNNAVLVMHRAQEGGFYHYETKNGINYVSYGANCTDSVGLTLGVASALAGGSVDINNKGSEIGVEFYKFVTEDNKTYYMPKYTGRKIDCIWWKKKAGVSGYVDSSIPKDAFFAGVEIKDDTSGATLLPYLLNGRIFDVHNHAHTFKNTGLPITFTVNGVQHESFIFSNFGNGNGEGWNTFANQYYAPYLSGEGNVEWVRIVAGKDGMYKVDTENRVKMGKITAAVGFRETFGNVG